MKHRIKATFDPITLQKSYVVEKQLGPRHWVADTTPDGKRPLRFRTRRGARTAHASLSVGLTPTLKGLIK